MKRIIGLVPREDRSSDNDRVIVYDGSAVTLAPHTGDDLVLLSLLRERDERVGNGRERGSGVFDFRYGPFTGGLGETGVLHLSTYGERILAVEVDLSIKHRAIEAGLTGLPVEQAIARSELVCGNFTFSHAHAFASAAEGALGVELPAADRRRALLLLELERLYNHLHVIMRLADAAAQKVLAAHLGALFEEALRLNALVSGSRYLRGTRRMGGVALSAELDSQAAVANIDSIERRFRDLYEASLSSRNYLDRLHGIAAVSDELARSRSLTGPSLRACGVAEDLRSADALYEGLSPVVREEGDSLARMEVRAEEVLASCAQIRRLVMEERGGRATAAPPEAIGSTDGELAAAGVEGPSGVVAWAVEVEGGRVRRAVASSPSIFGYQVFSEVFTGHIFTDFPFALDSFGLSFADAAR